MLPNISMGRLGLIALLVFSIVSCRKERQSIGPSSMQGPVSSDLQVVSRARVFFGHQSVGRNIIGGLQSFHSDGSLDSLRIILPEEATSTRGGFFAHTQIGKNGDPKTKCDQFAVDIARLGGDSIQIAMMKFCFADFTAETNVDSVFAYYQQTVTKVRTKYSTLRIVHVTAPLLQATPAWKRLAKWVLRREEISVTQNLKVNEYNRLLLSHCENEPIFDLARIESTYPDGTRNAVNEGPNPVYALIDEFTSDGGHLTDVGSQHVAGELVHVLAVALR